MEQRIRSSRHRDSLMLIDKRAARRRDLQEALLQHQPHIVHFCGHGQAGGILLEDDDGRARLVPADVLACVFKTLGDQTRLVVFNTCYSAEQAAAVTEYIDFAIGMREDIGSETATAFAASFYMGLGYGRSVRDAFEIGKNELALHALPALDQPVLLQRDGVDAASATLVASVASTPSPRLCELDDGPDPLILPWRQRLPRNGSLYNLLSWRYRLADRLIGRDAELEALVNWAEDGDGTSFEPRMHWISGPGGVGKTRLAAELCERLRQRGWKAGFIDPDDEAAEVEIPASRRGVCLILDYPEEQRERALWWTRTVAKARDRATPVCLLILSRRDLEEWKADLQRERAWKLCDETVVPPLTRLGPDDCVKLFRSAAQRYAETYGHEIPAIEDAAITAWYDIEPRTHGRPLFVMAAAIHAVLGQSEAISLRGGDIVRALVEREAAQLDRLGENLGLGPRTATTLCGLAAVTGGLDDLAIRCLAQPELELGLPAVNVAVECVARLPAWGDGALRAPSPDLVAAGLLHRCLKRQRDGHLAAESLWVAMALASERDAMDDVIDRFERLCFDADMVLSHGADSFRLGAAFARAIAGDVERAGAFEAVTSRDRLAHRLAPLAVSVAEVLIDDLREKAKDNPGRFLPDLAGSLNNLSNRLSDAGRSAEALTAIEESAEVHRGLAKDNPGRFLPDLAMSLNNLSVELSNEGQSAEALTAIEEAAEVYRGLAKDNPGRFLPCLATSLNNLSNHLSNAGRSAEALEAIEEAVESYQRLAQDHPGRFLPDLAMSLNNLSNHLSNADRSVEALTAIEEAAEVYRRLAKDNPGRFLPDLAMSLNNLSVDLSNAGRSAEALTAIEEAISYFRPIAEQIPLRFGRDLVRALNVLAHIHGELDQRIEAEKASAEATELQQQLTRPGPDG